MSMESHTLQGRGRKEQLYQGTGKNSSFLSIDRDRLVGFIHPELDWVITV